MGNDKSQLGLPKLLENRPHINSNASSTSTEPTYKKTDMERLCVTQYGTKFVETVWDSIH